MPFGCPALKIGFVELYVRMFNLREELAKELLIILDVSFKATMDGPADWLGVLQGGVASYFPGESRTHD